MESQRARIPRRRRIPTFSTISFSLVVLILVSFGPSPTKAYKDLSDNFLQQMPAVDADDFDIHNGELLAPLLIPRVPGTPGQKKAQEHIVTYFQRWLPMWNVIWQNSTSTTPATGDKQIPFNNLIFRRTPPWTKPGQSSLLTLVAHYDSKIEPKGFIGAIDSAAPCAVLMFVARAIDKYLTQMYQEMNIAGEGGTPEEDMGVQILFLDGEEAFVSWTDTDSLYGARALAAEWENTPYEPKSNFRNPLQQVSLFVLLDLLGSADTSIPSYFLTTHWAYKKLATLEGRLKSLNISEARPSKPIFPEADKHTSDFYKVGMGDDHVPFMARGAPVLHLIPSPFPRVWHTMADDGPHLDMKTVRDWARIMTAFVLEWLDMMEVEPPEPGTTAEVSAERDAARSVGEERRATYGPVRGQAAPRWPARMRMRGL
ncbi:putative glutaminyl-peptide cyclotransferase [Rhypophila decipiens]